MTQLAHSPGFKGASEQKTNSSSLTYIQACMLIFCSLVFLTVLLGLSQALAYFFLSPHSAVLLPSHQSWLYFVFSSVLFVLYTHHLINLLKGSYSDKENSSFFLFHTYLNLIADIVFLVYMFCLPLGKFFHLFDDNVVKQYFTEFKIGLAVLFSTLLFRVIICYSFMQFVKCQMIIQ